MIASFDRATLLWVRAHWGSVPGLRANMLDCTALGDFPTLCFVALAVAGWLSLNRRVSTAVFLLAQALLGMALVHAMKPWFGRARPEVVPHWAPFAGDSFPSGHSADSAILYLSLAILAGRLAPTVVHRYYFVAVAAVATMLVGVSRVYLGVHWPTDVAGGWVFGAGWATLGGVIANRLLPKRQTRSSFH